MFFDDLPKPKSNTFPKNLETLSIDELHSYIEELGAEIERAKLDISKKQAAINAAAAFFSSEE